MSTVGVAGWCIRRSVKGWQDKHHSIARTTMEDSGIDHAKVAKNPVEAWQPCHASLWGPSRNTEWNWINFWTIEVWKKQTKWEISVFWGFMSYISLVCAEGFIQPLRSSQRWEPAHPTLDYVTTSTARSEQLHASSRPRKSLSVLHVCKCSMSWVLFTFSTDRTFDIYWIRELGTLK